MPTPRICAALAAASLALLIPQAGAQSSEPLDEYNILWNSPSQDASGSMPIGNGRLGANAWVEPNGDLVLLLSSTDSFSEASRLLKLARVRFSMIPNPLAGAAAFRQELILREGRIQITFGDEGQGSRLSIHIDPDADVLHVSGESDSPVIVAAHLECWRTERRRLKGQELASSWTMRDAPEPIEVWESADEFMNEPGAVVWYHRNASSIVPFSLARQGVESLADLAGDPLLNRTFGGRMTGSDASFTKESPTSLKTSAPSRSFGIRISTHTSQAPSALAWADELREIGGDRSAGDSIAACAEHWSSFWDRSWIFVDGDRAEGIPANTHPVRIGVDSNGDNRFAGEIGRAAIYTVTLDDDSIASLARTSPTEPTRAGEPVYLAIAPPIGPLADTQGARVVNAFTIEAWIKPSSASSFRIFDKLTAGRDDGMLFDTHPGLCLRLITGSEKLQTSSCLKSDQWQHVAATFNAVSGRRAIYLNGTLISNSGAAADPAPPSRITQAYTLQRWITACGGRGDYPIKFNGSIFTVDPKFTGGPDLNPDWRRWGDCYWWQNTRFPYAPLLASGDFDLMHSLFNFYSSITPFCRARTNLYYNAKGVYFPETMTMFGAYANGDYGWNREGLAPRDISPCPWWQWAWNQGPELLLLMLDYYHHTEDEKFLREQLVPMARDVMLYFDSRFGRDANGKLRITPTQSAETYWHDVVNDTPCIAGLYAVLPRLMALPTGVFPSEDRELYARLLAAIPAVPTRTVDGKRFILPAEEYKDQRSNVENPELYTVFPFRLYGVGKPDLELARTTYNKRIEKSMLGWSYDGAAAAMLGLTDEAKRQLLAKAGNSHSNHRFPAMWGPNYDWLPDQCHGGNVMLTLQNMLMHTEGDRIELLPAWPRDWNVSFKLHAPGRTTVECVYREGSIQSLIVTPAARKHDVRFPTHLQQSGNPTTR